MAKMKLHTSLKSENELTEFDGYGIYQDRKLQYKDQFAHVTLLIGENNISMKRRHADYEIEMSFKLNEETTGTYTLHTLQKSTPLYLLTTKQNVLPNEIHITYQLWDEMYEFDVQYEVIK